MTEITALRAAIRKAHAQGITCDQIITAGSNDVAAAILAKKLTTDQAISAADTLRQILVEVYGEAAVRRYKGP